MEALPNVRKAPSDILTEELKDFRWGFTKWLKNTGKDDRVVVSFIKIPLDGKKTSSKGGDIDGSESKETS